MTLTLYIDRSKNQFVKSKTDSTPVTLQPFFQSSKVTLNIFVLEPNPTGGLAAPYTVLNVTGMSLRVGIGQPAGNSTPLAQTLHFSVGTLGGDKYFYGDFDLATAEVSNAIGNAFEVDQYIEIEISSDGSAWDKIIQLPTKLRATLFDAETAPCVGPVQFATDADSPVAVNITTRTLLCDSYLGPITVKLPQGPSGRRLLIKDASGYASTNAITIDPDVNDLENTALNNIVLTQPFEWCELVYHDGNWGRVSVMPPAPVSSFSPYDSKYYV